MFARVLLFITALCFTCIVFADTDSDIASNPAACPLRIEGLRTLPAHARIVLMPPDVTLYSISTGGVTEAQASWSEQAIDRLNQVFEAYFKSTGHPYQRVDTKSIPPELQEVNRVHSLVAQSIVTHHCGMKKLLSKHGQLDWSLGDSLQAIRMTTDAEYGLFVFIRDSYASTERKATMAAMALLGQALLGGMQTGYASLVNLKTGKIVWFNRLVRGTGDLREMQSAQETAHTLLYGFPL